ncbi:MAG: prepilin peptidase [Chloroflexi bacterium]|nr:prepilin peptidase [Chloroflexota bacterium]
MAYTLSGMMIVTLLLAVITDLRTRRISNRLTLPVAALGLAVHSVTAGWEGLAASGGGWLLAVGLLAAPFALGWLGAGDVKLVAAVGALQGPQFVLLTCIFTALFGGIVAVIALGREQKLRLALRHLFLSWWLPATPEMQALVRHRTPYAPAIALGALATLLLLA